MFFILAFEGDQVEKVMPQDMLEKEDLSRIMIISVSVIGVVLLVLNIGLVAGCMLKRRAKRIRGLFFFLVKKRKFWLI